MGSGRSNLYNRTLGSSQPYAPSYGVMPDMNAIDKGRGLYGMNGYKKNPTAKNINDVINGNYIGDKHTNRKFTYVIDLNGNIIIGERNGNGSMGAATPHPTLVGGKDPKVIVAGVLDVRGGKIFSFDNLSGHYKPNIKSLEAAKEAFEKLPKSLFHKKYGRNQ